MALNICFFIFSGFYNPPGAFPHSVIPGLVFILSSRTCFLISHPRACFYSVIPDLFFYSVIPDLFFYSVILGLCFFMSSPGLTRGSRSTIWLLFYLDSRVKPENDRKSNVSRMTNNSKHFVIFNSVGATRPLKHNVANQPRACRAGQSRRKHCLKIPKPKFGEDRRRRMLFQNNIKNTIT